MIAARALRVLLLEDRDEDAALLLHELRRAGFVCDWTRAQTEASYLAALADPPEIILADYSLPQFDALGALRLLAERDLDIPVIVVSGVMSEETCVQSLRHGAVDYLLKDRLTRLGPAVDQALAEHQLRRQREQAEQEAQHNAAMLRGVVDNAPSGMYLKDPEGRYLLVNGEFERLLGLSHGAAQGRTDHDLLSPSLANELARRDAHCLRRRAIVEQEEWLGQPQGAHSYLSVRYPLINAEGKVYAIGAIYTDITGLKRIEADLRATRAELQRQTDRLEQANADLQELDVLKTEFIASVSHELRTPLASIRGYTEMLADGDMGELNVAEQRTIAIIDRNGRRLLALVDDLLTTFRMDHDAFSLNIGPVEIGEVVEAIEVVIHATLPAGLILNTLVEPDLPIVPADADQLERVLLNLLSNAVKFSPGGGTITLRAYATDKDIVISVADPGIGVPEADQAKLFTRFTRASSARRCAIPGTGLGLSITKDIVERHGGKITLQSTPGTGTTVTFTLPRSGPVPS